MSLRLIFFLAGGDGFNKGSIKNDALLVNKHRRCVGTDTWTGESLIVGTLKRGGERHVMLMTSYRGKIKKSLSVKLGDKLHAYKR